MLWDAFRAYDHNAVGSISKIDFFCNICDQREWETDFGNAILELCDVKDEGTLDFGQFTQICGTFGAFQTKEMLQFCFFVFDKDKNGHMDEDELNAFVADIYGNAVPSNILSVIKGLNFDEDGRLYYPQFAAMHRQFPAVLYPVFQFQTNLRTNVMGAKWWNQRLARLRMDRDDKEAEEAQQEEQRKREEKRMRKKAMIEKMGWFQYYFNPIKRAQVAKVYAMGDSMAQGVG